MKSQSTLTHRGEEKTPLTHSHPHAHLHTSALIPGEQELIEVLNTTHTNSEADDFFLFSNFVGGKCGKAAKLTRRVPQKQF